MSRIRTIMCSAVLLLSTTAVPVAAQDGASARHPQAIVETLHEGLLDIMKKGPELGFSGRYEVIEPTIKDTFDLRTLAASSIGAAVWSKWDEDQRKAFVDTFERFLITNYARQFKSYSGQSFETVGTEPGPKETFIVKTRLLRNEKEPVELNYLTRARDGRMGIIDVYANGTSEAGRRRADFNEIYRQQGFEALLKEIDRLTADMAKGTEPS